MTRTAAGLRKAISMWSKGARRAPRRSTLPLAAVVVAGLCAIGAAPALGAQAWQIDSLSNTTVAPGGTHGYLVQLTNVGNAPMDGSPISFTATLPPHVTGATAEIALDPVTIGSPTIPCTAGDGVSTVAGATVIRCTDSDPLQPPPNSGISRFHLVRMSVNVDGGATGTLKTVFRVSGGGAPDAQSVDPTTVAPAPPGFGADAFDGQLLDAAGNPSTQAGGHPASAVVSIDFNTFTKPVPIAGFGWPVEPVKDVFVDLPPGLVGNPTVADRCTAPQLAFTKGLTAQPLCPATSQVGTVLLRSNNDPFFQPAAVIPVFNMVAPADVPGRFGFNFAGTVVVLDATVRSGGDYGITVNSRNISEALSIAGTTFTFWGVPAAASHDLERACPGEKSPFTGGPTCSVRGAPQLAFLRNPTSCTPARTGLPTTATFDSWFAPGDMKTATFFSHLPPAYPSPPSDWGAQQGPSNCDRVPFNPDLAGQPESRTPNTPSGFTFDLSLPQNNDPEPSIGTADLRSAVVTLPAGVRVNPSAADGLQACAPDQIRLHDGSSPSCPDASKVGTVTIKTPLLDDPLSGSIYLAKQNDNPFGTLLAIYLVVEGHGVVVKLAGRVEANPVTGQLTATFDDNPQTPVSDVRLEFGGGPRAQLVTPRECGPMTTHAVLTGWNGSVVERDSAFSISGDGNGAPCPAPKFSPVLGAGTKSNSAGRTSSMLVRVTRDDQDQELSGLTVNMPSGLTGKIANVDLCSDGDAAAGTCKDASKIGDVTVGAGAGSDPFFITSGRAYLTGPYKGAPFGLSIVVPAVAGPFDLGNVVVRSSIFVDKHTSDLRVVADPLPRILQGIPLQVRDVRVNVDRPDFFVNPTSCAEKTITADLTSTEGASASSSTRFQAADCGSLGFKPRMVLTVGGRGHVRRGQTTPLSTTVTMPRGDANLRFVRVTLPPTINARLTVIQDACTRAEFETDVAKCTHAKAGTAVASTPLLRRPLRGGVYFVKDPTKPRGSLPNLIVALRGQVAFDLIGRITIPGGNHLATTFDAAPDVPIRSFTLKLVGDPSNASVGDAANLCTARSRAAKAQLDYIAQNGKVRQIAQKLVIRGCPAKKAKHRGRAQRRR